MKRYSCPDCGIKWNTRTSAKQCCTYNLCPDELIDRDLEAEIDRVELSEEYEACKSSRD